MQNFLDLFGTKQGLIISLSSWGLDRVSDLPPHHYSIIFKMYRSFYFGSAYYGYEVYTRVFTGAGDVHV
jgi:hypothetical protein